jgi:hypothetical protein
MQPSSAPKHMETRSEEVLLHSLLTLASGGLIRHTMKEFIKNGTVVLLQPYTSAPMESISSLLASRLLL